MDKSHEKIIAALECSPILIALYDPSDRLSHANRAFRETFSIDPDECPTWAEIMRRNFHTHRGTVIDADDFEAWLTSTQSRRGKVGFRSYETDLVDGRWLWMKESVSEDGWMLCVASDVTNLHTDRRDLRQDRDTAVKTAHTDELTGVTNRRFVMARIEEMLQECTHGTDRPGCLAILDIDRFKDINDGYGHMAGDHVLCAFAKEIGSHVRRSDCFGRVGGEEFALVMPRTPCDEAVAILERMLARIRASRPLQQHSELTYTFSVGVAACKPGDVALSFFGRADKALYKAKTDGRNRISVADTD